MVAKLFWQMMASPCMVALALDLKVTGTPLDSMAHLAFRSTLPPIFLPAAAAM